jgi:hypothetical protein
MQLYTIEVAPLGNALAAKPFTPRNAKTGYADIVADSYCKRVEQVLGRSISLFKEPAELVKEADGQLINHMQSWVQTRLAEQAWHKAGLLHKMARVLKIAVKVQRSSQSRGNHFSRVRPRLWSLVWAMVLSKSSVIQ